MTSELQTDRYSQIIRRAGAMIGPGGRVVEVLTELFPVIDLEHLPPELLALGGWRMAWGNTERPGSVGDVSTSQLFNPADSNVIASVTQVLFNTSVAAFITGQVQTDQIGGTPVRGLFRDGRFGGNRETTLTTEHVDGTVIGSGFRLRLNINEQISIRDDNGIAVLPPGFGLAFSTSAADVVFSVCYWWRERSAEQSELNF